MEFYCKNYGISTKAQFNYLVISTGYDGRLVEHATYIEVNCKKRLDVCQNVILYIQDREKCCYQDESDEEDCDHIRKLVNSNSLIALRCENILQANIILRVLMKTKHCACFSLNSIIDMQLNQDVLLVEFDCESG